jgi:hypothetical protein
MSKRGNNLNVGIGRSIIERNELIVSERTNPPHYNNIFLACRLKQKLFYLDSFVKHMLVILAQR